jgi:hypothetical protein
LQWDVVPYCVKIYILCDLPLSSLASSAADPVVISFVWQFLSLHSNAHAQYSAVLVHSVAVNQFLMFLNGKCRHMLEGQSIRCITTEAGICGETGTNAGGYVEMCSVSHCMA